MHTFIHSLFLEELIELDNPLRPEVELRNEFNRNENVIISKELVNFEKIKEDMNNKNLSHIEKSNLTVIFLFHDG